MTVEGEGYARDAAAPACYVAFTPSFQGRPYNMRFWKKNPRICQEYEFPHRQQYRVMWNPSGRVAKKQNTEIIEIGSFEHVPLAHMLSFGF